MRDNAHQSDRAQTGYQVPEHNPLSDYVAKACTELYERVVEKLSPEVVQARKAAKAAHEANPDNAPGNKFLPGLTITH